MIFHGNLFKNIISLIILNYVEPSEINKNEFVWILRKHLSRLNMIIGRLFKLFNLTNVIVMLTKLTCQVN